MLIRLFIALLGVCLITTPAISQRGSRSSSSGQYRAPKIPTFKTPNYSPRAPKADVYVAPYFKKDGTLVDGHFRTSPNDSFYDNYSTKPNINPYTGKEGTKISPAKPSSSRSYPYKSDAIGNSIPNISLSTPKSTNFAPFPNQNVLHTPSYREINSNNTSSNQKLQDTITILQAEIAALRNEISVLRSDKEKEIQADSRASFSTPLEIYSLTVKPSDYGLVASKGLVESKALVLKTDTFRSQQNRDAEPIFDPSPELTADMKRRSFKTSLRVRITIDANGSHSEEITQGTGDGEIDLLVLQTMRRWKWRPAYMNGIAVKSTRTYGFRISID